MQPKHIFRSIIRKKEAASARTTDALRKDHARMTRFRLLCLLAVAVTAAVVLVGTCLLNKHTKLHFGILQRLMLLTGVLLVEDTILVSYLSNFNLGVILPAILGVPLIALGFLVPYMGHGFWLFLKWFIAGCYCVAVCIFAVCGFLMVRAARGGQQKEADAIIVLGAAVHGDRVTWILSNRLDAAIEYLNAHEDCIAVVSGGQGDEESVTEASAMKKYMVAHGIAEDRVIEEGQATDTKENFAYSAAIIRGRLGEDARIGFVTTGFHCFRAGAVAKAQGIDAFAIPAADVWYIALNNFLRECVGICVYTLRGNI